MAKDKGKSSKCKEIWEQHSWWAIPTIIFIGLLIVDGCFTHWIINPNKHTINISACVLFVTVLGLIGYSVRQHQKLVAEQIAKARIDWLKEMREHVADYINTVNTAYDYGMKHMEVFNKNAEIDDEVRKKYTALKQKVEKNYALIMFNLNPNEKITQQLNDYLQVANDPVTPSEKRKHETELFKKVQSFFKDEWEKAKKEIQTGKVDK